jgi:hypothetical protein
VNNTPCLVLQESELDGAQGAMLYKNGTQELKTKMIERIIAAEPYISKLQCKEGIVASEVMNARIACAHVSTSHHAINTHTATGLAIKVAHRHATLSASPQALFSQLPRVRCPFYIVASPMFLTRPRSQHPLHIANGTIHAC